MTREQLLRLLSARNLSASELRTREPQLAAELDSAARDAARRRVLDSLASAPAPVRDFAASIDLTTIPPALVATHIRTQLETSATAPAEARAVADLVRDIDVTVTGGTAVVDPRGGLGENPDVGVLLAKARVHQIADLAKLEAPVAEAVATAIATPTAVSEATLGTLVSAGTLTEAAARNVGTAASIYGLVDEQAALAGELQSRPFAALGGRPVGSTRDLAVLTAADLEPLLPADLTLPEGTTRTNYAEAVAGRFATLHPDLALLGGLPRPPVAAIQQHAAAIQPLLANNPALLDRDFAALNTSGLAGSLAPLQAAHGELRRLSRAYPGLQLEGIITDSQRSAADKAAAITRRVGFIDKLRDKFGSGQLFDLDLSPDSSDIAGLDLQGLGATADEQPLIVSTLKAYQRVFGITRRADATQRLLEAGYTSATRIATSRVADFAASTGLDAAAATKYWKDARGSLMETTFVVGSLLDLQLGLFDEIGSGNVQPGVEDYLRKLGGYEDLFGSLSFCSCEHCQSILGPAAYFVDLMRYVDEHIRPQFGSDSAHPLDLKTRRPDLWTLELTCANTNDRIPTLDIVNEILENFIAARHGFTGSVSDRAAVRDVVYGDVLVAAIDSFEQPFHLPLTRIDAYLRALEVARSAIVRAVGGAQPSEARSELHLSPEEWAIVTTPDAALNQLQKLYGISFSVTGTTVAPVDVQEVLAATALTRTELGDMVAASFIRAGADVQIRAEKRSADSVQNDIERVHGLTLDVLDRLHRFTRLWRKLPWSIAELDRVLVALGFADLNSARLQTIAALRHVQQTLETGVDETMALITPLPATPTGQSLLDRLFNGPTLGEIGPLPLNTHRFVHPSFRSQTAVPPDPILPRLLAGVGVDLEGLGTLARTLAPFLQAQGTGTLDPEAADENARFFVLSLDNLTLLYRHARLARALGVSIQDLFVLIEFAEIDGRMQTLDHLERLIDLHAWWKRSGYTLDDIAVATGRTPRDASRYPDPAAVAAALIGSAPSTLTFKPTVFSVALGTPEQASRDLLTANPTIVEAMPNDGWRLVPGVDLAAATVNVPATAVVPVAPSGSRPVTADEIRTVLQRFRPAAALARSLGSSLNTDAAKLDAVAQFAGVALGSEAIARALFGEQPPAALEEAIRTLVPAAVAFAPRTFTAPDVDFVRLNPSLFDKPAAGLTLATLRALSAYARIAQRRMGNAFDAPLVDRADLQATLLSYDASAGAFPGTENTRLARIIGVDAGILAGLRGRINLPAVAASAIEVLDEAARLAARLGLDGELLVALAGNDFDSLSRAADSLRFAVANRRTDAKERQKALDAVEEPLREQQRGALAAFLVHSLQPSLFARSDDLSPHFLVDVNAGGCSTTSRVVAAISSVQLYIHRVLMNLEQTDPDAASPLVLHLPEAAAAEWSWRKNYRVWEANRKVFLWPENYIEPDLRDDKTPLFEELETELLQTDIDEQNVLDAYTKYLKGFEELASLTVAGAYHDVRREGGDTTDVLHLFGVTSTDPPLIYYRTCQNLIANATDSKRIATWSPWRVVDAQISSRRVSPVVYRGRLHLFWTDYRTRSINRVENGASEFGGYRHTATLKFTTLRADGSWSTPQPVQLPDTGDFGPGHGVIQDPLDGPAPWLDTKPHPEAIDDYTLSGPNWEWLWFEPVQFQGREVLGVRFRNFFGKGYVDLFRRRLVDAFTDTVPQPPPQVLCAKNGTLHVGAVQLWGLLWRWNKTATANLVIDADRLAVLGAENNVTPLLATPGLYAEQIATLRPGTDLLAVPGSIEDALLQVGPDLLLLQGTARDDDRYTARRIGTTLAEEVSYRLFLDGVDGLLDIETQKALKEAGLPLSLIGSRIEDRTNTGKLDFTGPYGTYYREIFFQIPFLIANALNGRGQFATAQRWYNYIFDPTATEIINVPAGTPPAQRARMLLDRVWRYLEFRNLDVARVRDMLTDPNALAVHRQDPFNPHAIARLRISAYQKAIVMKYIDNVIDWADHLFTQFTMESVNEALMLYGLAADLLGRRPARLGDCGEGAITPKNYEQIAPTIGAGEEILIELESLISSRRVRPRRRQVVVPPRFDIDRVRVNRVLARVALPTRPGLGEVAVFEAVLEPAVSDPLPAAPPGRVFEGMEWKDARTGGWSPRLGLASRASGAVLDRLSDHRRRGDLVDQAASFGWSIVRHLGPVFCVPANKTLLAYWDRVEDRLFKIRHCMDITGQKRELALFAPEIDPGLLVRMRAAGLSLDDVLDSTSGNLPPYRFLYLIDRAKALASSLSGFGMALLSALEKNDGEQLSRLRIVQQQNLTRMTTQVRRWEIQTAEEALEGVDAQIAAAEYRRDFYQGLIDENRTGSEVAQSIARHTASTMYAAEAVTQTVRGVTALVMQVGSGFAMKWGGLELTGSAAGFAAVAHAAAQGSEAVGASTGLEAGFDRRNEGWKHQKKLADLELDQLQRQRTAASLRVEIANRALALHERSLDQLDEMLEFLDGKLTNLGLYTWLSTELRRLYRNGYQNALALARLAEQAFRFERDEDAGPTLAPTYWDPLHAGLLAGEQLLIDLQSLERRYLETNYRGLEVDQAFALSQIAPEALLQLRQTGECRFTIGELFFDVFYPGQYKRRIKGVRLTIPSITGPYVNVSATLTLERSWIRPTAATTTLVEIPPRRSVSVATSTAQNDAGVFELSFRDERYMPFEGAGAISQWHLVLPKAFRQFDYQTINDVILSASYTAEQDGALRERVESDNATIEGSLLAVLATNPLRRVFSMRQDFSPAFSRLLHSPLATDVRFEVTAEHFPALVRNRQLSVVRTKLLVRAPEGVDVAGLTLSLDGVAVTGFAPDAQLGNVLARDLPATFNSNVTAAHTISVQNAGALALPSGAIDPERLLDVVWFIEYGIQP